MNNKVFCNEKCKNSENSKLFQDILK